MTSPTPEFSHEELTAAAAVPFIEYLRSMRDMSPEQKERAERLLKEATTYVIERSCELGLVELPDEEQPHAGYLLLDTTSESGPVVYKLQKDPSIRGQLTMLNLSEEESVQELNQAIAQGYTHLTTWDTVS